MLAAFSVKANTVTVQEVGVNPTEVVEIYSSALGGDYWVYAGLNKLLVDSVATDAFCIDPFHWSASGAPDYTSEPLSSAPKTPGGPMGYAKAKEIEQLWQQYYSTATTDAATAAGLQIAIWEIIGSGNPGGASFSLVSGDDYGAAGMLSWLTANPNADEANLLGVSGPGQDYVIPNSGGGGSVPDGGTTLMLLGGTLCCLATIRRKVCRS